MALFFSPEITDVAAQAAVVQGVDSNVFQTAGTPPTRHPALYTSLEASLGLIGRGRIDGEGEDLRMFGRFMNYEPLGPSFESRALRGGLSYRTVSRLDRRTTVLTSWLGSIGSLQAARGTDGDAVGIDPVSTRRTVWNGAGAVTFAFQLSARNTLQVLTGIDLMGTIAETVPGTDEVRRRGIDYLTNRSRFSLQHRLDPRTTLEGALMLERFHVAYVLGAGSPSGTSFESIDGGAATATLGLSRALTLRTSANLGAGVAYVIPRFGDEASVLPVGAAGLIHAREAFSASMLAGFQYGLAQPRVGPGASATLTLLVVGRPLGGRARNAFEIVGEAGGQQTGITVGPNDGASVTSGGGAVMLRWGIGGGFGVLVGYDFRATHLVPAPPAEAPPWYVRHLGYIGLSYAWGSTSAVSAMPTLARPMPAAFIP